MNALPRVVECRFFQRKAVSVSRRLVLSERSIELLGLHNQAETPAVILIPWADTLGASLLTTNALVHVPTYKPTAYTPVTGSEAVDFVVFGCIPKADLVKSRGFMRSFRALSCLDGGALEYGDCLVEDDKGRPVKKKKCVATPGSGYQRDRVLVQWVFRYNTDDSSIFVPELVNEIQRLADPRSTPQSSSETVKAESLPRRVSC